MDMYPDKTYAYMLRHAMNLMLMLHFFTIANSI